MVAGLSLAEVAARVDATLRCSLSPLPLPAQPRPPAAVPSYPHADTGWPLRTAVSAAELAAFATRVEGVHLVNRVLLAPGVEPETDRVELSGLRLPQVARIAVTVGDPVPVADLRAPALGGGPPGAVPVPVFAESC